MNDFHFDIGLTNNFAVSSKNRFFDKEEGSPRGDFKRSAIEKSYVLGISTSAGYNVYKRFYLSIKAVHLFLKEDYSSKFKNMQYTVGIDYRLK